MLSKIGCWHTCIWIPVAIWFCLFEL